MKNILSYYYHFANISLHYHNEVYTFEKNGFFYRFQKLERSFEESRQIYQLLIERATHYHKIILNRDHQFITIVDQKPYVLLQLSKIKTENIMEDLNKIQIVEENKNYSLLRRDNWTKLWSLKVDYFEYQLEHIEPKYQLLTSSIYYYIGLAENAISYVENTNLYEKKEWQDQLSFNHIRLNQYNIENYDDPFTIVLDHKARDVSEYLKYLFFSNQYKTEDIEIILKNLKFSRYGYRLLFARLLYPSYYFDLYEQIIIGKREEKEIIRVIQQAEDYRYFLKIIYYNINKIVEIPPIDWL